MKSISEYKYLAFLPEMRRANDFRVVSAFAAKSNEIKNDLLLDVCINHYQLRHGETS